MERTDQQPLSILGLDIGGTKIACVEGDRRGRVLDRQAIPTLPLESFDRRFPAIVAMLKTHLARARAASREVIALSIAVGGPLRIGDGILLDPPHLPSWHGVRLKEQLTAEFPGMPIFIEHDGNAGALEVAKEAGRRMGQGLALLVDALNPQVIVLGSLAVVLGERILMPARQFVLQEALPQAAAACAIVPSALGSRIGDVVSLMAALTDASVANRMDNER